MKLAFSWKVFFLRLFLERINFIALLLYIFDRMILFLRNLIFDIYFL